jgi:hypothetical protein
MDPASEKLTKSNRALSLIANTHASQSSRSWADERTRFRQRTPISTATNHVLFPFAESHMSNRPIFLLWRWGHPNAPSRPPHLQATRTAKFPAYLQRDISAQRFDKRLRTLVHAPNTSWMLWQGNDGTERVVSCVTDRVGHPANAPSALQTKVLYLFAFCRNVPMEWRARGTFPLPDCPSPLPRRPPFSTCDILLFFFCKVQKWTVMNSSITLLNTYPTGFCVPATRRRRSGRSLVAPYSKRLCSSAGMDSFHDELMDRPWEAPNQVDTSVADPCDQPFASEDSHQLGYPDVWDNASANVGGVNFPTGEIHDSARGCQSITRHWSSEAWNKESEVLSCYRRPLAQPCSFVDPGVSTIHEEADGWPNVEGQVQNYPAMARVLDGLQIHTPSPVDPCDVHSKPPNDQHKAGWPHSPQHQEYAALAGSDNNRQDTRRDEVVKPEFAQDWQSHLKMHQVSENDQASANNLSQEFQNGFYGQQQHGYWPSQPPPTSSAVLGRDVGVRTWGPGLADGGHASHGVSSSVAARAGSATLDRPILEGWLRKRSTGGWTWRKRYFSLSRHSLLYRATATNQGVEKLVPLCPCSLACSLVTNDAISGFSVREWTCKPNATAPHADF